MDGMTAEQFVEYVDRVGADSTFVALVQVVAKSNRQVKIRVYLMDRTMISVYYNE